MSVNKEERFEKVVEDTEAGILAAVVSSLIIFLIMGYIFGLDEDIGSFVAILVILIMGLGALIILHFSFRKVYWRKVK